MKKTWRRSLVWTFVVILALSAQGAAETRGKATSDPSHPVQRPDMVYVADFVIDAGGMPAKGRIGRILPGRQQDPEAEARKLVDLLAENLTQELQDRRIPARRFYQGQDMPRKGWLVSGELLDVDEGNRLRRAAIGFGAGATEMMTEISISDMSSNPDEPFLVCGTGSMSGRGPGAIVTKNPYVAAAKFVMSKRSPERDVAKIARQIAEVIASSIEEIPRP